MRPSHFWVLLNMRKTSFVCESSASSARSSAEQRPESFRTCLKYPMEGLSLVSGLKKPEASPMVWIWKVSVRAGMTMDLGCVCSGEGTKRCMSCATAPGKSGSTAWQEMGYLQAHAGFGSRS